MLVDYLVYPSLVPSSVCVREVLPRSLWSGEGRFLSSSLMAVLMRDSAADGWFWGEICQVKELPFQSKVLKINNRTDHQSKCNTHFICLLFSLLLFSLFTKTPWPLPPLLLDLLSPSSCFILWWSLFSSKAAVCWDNLHVFTLCQTSKSSVPNMKHFVPLTSCVKTRFWGLHGPHIGFRYKTPRVLVLSLCHGISVRCHCSAAKTHPLPIGPLKGSDIGILEWFSRKQLLFSGQGDPRPCGLSHHLVLTHVTTSVVSLGGGGKMTPVHFTARTWLLYFLTFEGRVTVRSRSGDSMRSKAIYRTVVYILKAGGSSLSILLPCRSRCAGNRCVQVCLALSTRLELQSLQHGLQQGLTICWVTWLRHLGTELYQRQNSQKSMTTTDCTKILEYSLPNREGFHTVLCNVLLSKEIEDHDRRNQPAVNHVTALSNCCSLDICGGCFLLFHYSNLHSLSSSQFLYTGFNAGPSLEV